MRLFTPHKSYQPKTLHLLARNESTFKQRASVVRRKLLSLGYAEVCETTSPRAALRYIQRNPEEHINVLTDSYSDAVFVNNCVGRYTRRIRVCVLPHTTYLHEFFENQNGRKGKVLRQVLQTVMLVAALTLMLFLPHVFPQKTHAHKSQMYLQSP